MPPAKSTKPVPAAPAEPAYPAIEWFIETASAQEVEALFNPVKDALAALKGPRAENAKKVGKGIARTEELLSYLLQVREKLEAERKGGGKRR
jgi:hypothetical protein